MKPAIVHAPDYPAPYGGNFIASLTALAALCREHGFRTVMALPEAARSIPWCAALAAAGQPMHFLPDKTSTLQYAQRLAALAAAENAVILHTHFIRYDVAACLAKLMLRLRGRKLQIVWHAHSELRGPSLPEQRLRKWVKYRLFGSAVHMIAVAGPVAADLLAVGAPKAAVHMVPNGIDIERATAASRPPAEVLAALGLDDGRQLLLLFGWDPLRKGTDLACDMAETLAGEGCNIVLGAVGTAELRQYAETRAAGRALPWLRLLTPLEHVADLYQAAAMFLSPSRSEGLPYSVCEAMANGIPVVLSDIAAMAFARPSPGAVFAAPGDSRSLAEAVRSVLAWTPDQRQRRCRANQDLIRREFDVRTWAERVFQIYQDILQGQN